MSDSSKALISQNLQSQFVELVEAFGNRLVTKIARVGGFLIFLKEIAHWTVKPPFRINLLVQQLEFIGNQSLNIIMISAESIYVLFFSLNASFFALPGSVLF